MRTSTWLTAAVAAFVAGIVLVVACSDDSPGDADAAVCDCPAAEAPLAGRIVSMTASRSVAANGLGAVEAVCPQGATILGGGCRLEIPGGMILEEAGIDRINPTRPVYTCFWRSTVPDARMATAEAICLVPAP